MGTKDRPETPAEKAMLDVMVERLDSRDLDEFTIREWIVLVQQYQAALKTALQIHDEFLSQIGRCTSQDYARLNEFPITCRELGVTLEPRSIVKFDKGVSRG